MRRWAANFFSFPDKHKSLQLFKISAVLFPALVIFLLNYFRDTYFTQINTLYWSLLLSLVAVILSALFLGVLFIVDNRVQRADTRRARELATLNDLSQTLDKFHTMTALLHPAMEKLRQITDSDILELYLAGQQSRELGHAVHLGTPEDSSAAELQTQLQERLEEDYVRLSKQVLVGEVDLLPEGNIPVLERGGIKSMAIVPLKAISDVVGIVFLFSRSRDRYQPDESRFLLDIGSRIAVAIERARLYEKVQAVAVLEERERISAELHDGLAQVLGYVITKSQATRQLLRKMSEANDYLVELENVAQEVYTDTREAILGLRTAVSGNRSMVSAIREYALRFNQMHNIRIELVTGENIIPSLPPQVELQVIRIVQEALSNIRKHARATHAIIKLNAGEGAVTIAVEDDGKGFVLEKGGQGDWTKFGIRNMKERAESINGILSIESALDKGTTVTLTIPLNLAQERLKKGEKIESIDRR